MRVVVVSRYVVSSEHVVASSSPEICCCLDNGKPYQLEDGGILREPRRHVDSKKKSEVSGLHGTRVIHGYLFV